MKIKLLLKRIIKYSVITVLIGGIIILAVVLLANNRIESKTHDYVFDTVDSIPPQKAALVLGTAKRLRGGFPNLYFSYRIDAASELYKAKKVEAIVVSGDNRHVSYNEPRDMMNALIEKGIPDSVIYLDYAGFRTLDSVVRMKEIFSQDSFIIVSQKFHNQRAIYLGQHAGIKAYGYNAKDLELNRSSIKTKVREKFARVKAFIDVVIDKQPKFLGEKIEIK